MSVQVVKGDLFDPEFSFEAIGHGVNCKGKMGAGIAKAFKAKFPDMYDEYVFQCEFGLLTPGDVFVHWDGDSEQFILNLASQNLPGADATTIWLAQSLYKGFEAMDTVGITHLGLPWIGCGIGGLTKEEVLPLIERVSAYYPRINVTIVEL